MDKNDHSPRPHRVPPPPVPATLDVDAFDSHGVARAQYRDRPIEVEHGIPGERVDALVYGKRRTWAKIAELLQPSPDRVDAPCPHFHQGCGGCQWQMLNYESQIARKLLRVERQISLAELSTSIGRVHTMEEPWRYRVTAGISLGRHVGFRRRGSQSIVGLDDCLISHPLIGRLAASLNVAIEAGELPDFLGKVGLEVRVVEKRSPDAQDDRVEDRLHFNLQPSTFNFRHGVDALHCCIVPSPGSPHASIDAVMPLAKFLARSQHVVGVLYRHRQDAPELLFREPFAMVHVLERPFYLSAATFFQTNLQLLPALVESLLEAAAATPADTVVDVYGGVALFGLLLAPLVKRVVEIEIDPVGLEAAKRSAALHSLTNIEFLTGTAESLLPQIGRAETVVVDPPRAGLTPKVLAAIGAMRPKRILYVSCQAESMVRDIQEFAGQGYAVGDIEVFDFYPQTQHVELFCALTAQSAQPGSMALQGVKFRERPSPHNSVHLFFTGLACSLLSLSLIVPILPFGET